MRFTALFGLALAALPSAALATDYLYTFTGVVTYADNSDATDIYANVGNPISFSLRVPGNFPTVNYSYGTTGSSAIGGPDYAPGTLFPVDRTVSIDPSLGSGVPFTPLESGYSKTDDYSASISKDLPTHSLSFTVDFQTFIPPDPYCTDHCGGTLISHSETVQAYSNQFTSPDFRELGTFKLTSGSDATLHDSIVSYPGPVGDNYDIALSSLTVQRLASAAPEPASWALTIVGFGMIGARKRQRRRVTGMPDQPCPS